ncbi:MULTISPECIES: DUF4185 domain-containing protein [Mycolicibacterium]|uniref:DUF4185 domain-containing protein n=1 Tax=Mycolicibacterium TaxID=1866885 RepID=UPI000F9D61EC|nr:MULTISPECIES: DUF4185 domain-containing protein [Mycolicibacterium]RUP32302.1 MAG: DUF4185 domain-containing protein [Mycolicibacterium sp.]UCZ61086.1 DUF4185 domain-containing protein [Mycolicibacterium phocaicum]
MSAARYIGRVGRLAVALGIGTAIASGQGAAWADQTDTGASGGPAAASATGETAGASGTSGSSAKPRRDKPRPKKGDDKTGTPAAGTTGDSASDPKAETPSDPKTEKPAKAPGKGRDRANQQKNNNANDAAPAAAVPKTPKRPRVTPDPTAAVKPVAGRQTATAPKPVSVAAVAPTVMKVTASAVTASPTPVAATTNLLTPNVTAPTAKALNPVAAVMKAVSGALNWAFNPMGSPAQPTLAWTVMAFARKEIDNLLTAIKPQNVVSALTTTGQVLSNPMAALTTIMNPRPAWPTPGLQLSPSTSFVDWVTGNFAPNDTYSRFGVWGTDVGTAWDNGIADDPSTPINEHQVLMAFGDTFSGPNMTGNWLNNILFRSSDANLADGISIPAGQWFNGNMFGGTPLSSPTTARQIILPAKLPAGLPSGVTLIPTSGISVPTPGTQFGATQYLSFMSVKQWGAPGQWTTNYSAMAYSTDNGENWTIAPQSVRQNWGGNANFQQAALVRPGDGYVYSYGTPNGRGGAAYISRVAEADILDASKYEYYNKGSAGGWFGIGAIKQGWYKDPSKAGVVFGRDTGACGIGKPGNQVSEMSVQYNPTLGKYVTLYGDQFNNIVLRTADRPEGTWSAATVLMPQQNGGIYAPMMQPWSPSTLGTGTDLYWNLSLWSEYNVMLMKTDLTKL